MLFLLGLWASQLSWNGGGVPGPVTNWYRFYWRSEGVTDAHLGLLSLQATGADLDNWVSHTVEGSGVSYGAQGVLPADVDGDGDWDLVAPRGDYVVWYENTGSWNFTRHTVGNAPTDGDYSCTYPADIDGDGDVDIAVATNQVGVGWYEQVTPTSWVWHLLEARDDQNDGYHRVLVVDFDLDGDQDILAVDNSYPSSNSQDDESFGDIVLFRQSGGSFSKEVLWDFPQTVPRGFYLDTFDLNGDAYPDLYAVGPTVILFLNDSGRAIDSVYAHGGGSIYGGGVGDPDANGWVDVGSGARISANEIWQLAELNQGDGSFITDSLDGTHGTGTNDGWEYQYGGRFGDYDLDGDHDLAVTGYYTAWYRQVGRDPLTYEFVGNIDGWYASDWVFPWDMDAGCSPDLDLIVVRGALLTGGSIKIYENRVPTGLRSFGWLESSVLSLAQGSGGGDSLRLVYRACVPNDTALAFYWRVGESFEACTSAAWQGPLWARVGEGWDTLSLDAPCSRYFQYRVEFRGGSDAATLKALRLEWHPCDPLYSGGHEGVPACFSVRLAGGNLLLYVPKPSEVEVSVYDASGRLASVPLSARLQPGRHSLSLSLKPGVYFVRVLFGKEERRLRAVVK